MLLEDNFRRKSVFLLAAVTAVLLWGCLNNEQQPETFDLPAQFADSLSGYDRVLVILKDASGNPLDTLFQGKVSSESQLKDLSAPHFKGGKAILSIIGYKSGVVAYEVDRLYDGQSGSVEEIKPLVLPSTRVKIGVGEMRIASKASAALPPVTIEPNSLLNKVLRWSSSNPSVLKVEGGKLHGLKAGTATLRVKLESDTSKGDAIPVEVYTNPTLPDSLKISPDTLTLVAGGRLGQFTVAVVPSLVPASVTWYSVDSSIAGIGQDGQVTGLKAGQTAIISRSTEDPSISDTAMVAVLAPMPVQSVRFGVRSLILFVGGANEELAIEVKPADASQAVGFIIRDSSLVGIEGAKATGKKEGVTWIKAYSKASPDKADSIPVTVLSAQRVESVSISADSITLFTGGASQILTASVLPANATSWISWRSADPLIAAVDTAGKVSPHKAGRTQITAVSKADSTRKDNVLVIVRKDTPKLNVGGDLTISAGTTVHFAPTADQDYGKIALFEWDLNGDGKWDSSSTSLLELDYKYQEAKEVTAAFHVRDTEGNDTTATRKIKAVNGPLIRILSPEDGAYFNTTLIDVSWTVDGTPQTNFLKETLKEGPNPVTRSAADAAGKVYSVSITVYLDTKAPVKPTVKGQSLANTLRPTWTWASGGGGKGVYRFHLDSEDFTSAAETQDTVYMPGTELTAQTHTLYVQEKDQAGNWSPSGSWSIRIDTDPPNAPVFDSLPLSPINSLQPTWTWKSGGNGGIGVYRVALDNANLDSGGSTIMMTQFLAPLVLTAAAHTLHIQEKDSAGNWSKASAKQLVLAPREVLGKAGFSTAGIGSPSLALSPTDVPYFAFQDAPANGSKAIVMRFNGTAWEMVGGAPISAGGAGDISLVISSSGVPYVAFSDAPQSDKATVMRFNGTKWENIGTQGFTPGGAYFISLALGPSDVPYIAYRDGANTNRLGIRKFDGSNWVDVGGLGSTGQAASPSIAISSTGVPYVAFQDFGAGGKASLIRLSGNFWQNIGVAGFTSGAAKWTSLALTKADVPYVAYQDGGNSFKASVMRYTGSAWEYVGSAGFSQGAVNYTDIQFDNAGVPYVGYQDAGNGYKATVARFRGTAWESVGPAGFSADEAAFTTTAVTPLGVPYVGYRDASVLDKATVMRTSF